jgi:hypothetical protein
VALKDERARDALADVDALAEADALAAFALEERDPPAAREAWGRYLAGAGGKGPWADHARSRGHGGKSGRNARTPNEPSAPNARSKGKEK